MIHLASLWIYRKPPSLTALLTQGPAIPHFQNNHRMETNMSLLLNLYCYGERIIHKLMVNGFVMILTWTKLIN